MNAETGNIFGRFLAKLLVAVVLVGFYALWTHSTDWRNLTIISSVALIASFGFARPAGMPRISPKRISYAIAYLPYLALAILKANFDVARRIISRRIPINPGIVKVRTKLASPTGRTVLANSITLTPGTLSVEIRGKYLYIHWIDVTDMDEEGATREIVAGFEKYLEVIFG
jgi:multicomponent Na+:H+ antiporter subunit E